MNEINDNTEIDEVSAGWSSLVVDGKVPRETILEIERAMLGDEVPNIAIDDHNISCPVTHHFAPGMYGREFHLPKGYVVVGKIHKHSHLSTIIKGDVSVLTENGVERLTAPHVFVSYPGAKRVVYAHEDTIWVTFHPTEETDLEKIEDHVIAKSFEEYDKHALGQAEKKEITL
jgi:quercetin dioxygenase-like cupin family protein